MTIQLIAPVKTRRDFGFSMIDVLVAIVVLATGLLALAVLQGGLTRNNADARARSQIAAFSEGLVDQLRAGGYDSIGAPSFPAASGQPLTMTVSPSSTTCPDTSSQAKEAYCAQSAAGVTNMQSTIKVWQYAITSSTNPAFAVTAGTPTPDSGAYKQVNVTTTWTDAVGQTRSLSFDTIISPVTVDTTNTTLASTDFPSSIGNSPTVRQTNPATTLGVIPIAINTDTNSNSAATNPKPVVTNTGTTFSTYTYAPSTLGSSTHPGEVISKRVDTKVIQCSCKAKANGGVVTTDPNLGTILSQPYRPTYWDGAEYTTPNMSSASTSLTGVDSTATQDTACDVCCRDRNDSTSDTPKFDNFSNDYDGNQLKHYNYQSGTLTEVYPTNQTTTKPQITTFLNTCRLIRVNGSYVAATDAHNYFFGLLPTDTCANQGSSAAPTGCTSSLTASDTVPASTDETNYANFVVNYLYSSRASLAAGNGPTNASTDPLNTDSVATLYNGYGLNLPANITISLPNTVSRWLYARGLYIDHLESSSTAGISAAQEALNTAITNCGTSPTQAQLQNCILPVLPFTTVNMTELANWSTNASGVITVSNTAVIGGDETSPKRGNVTVPSTQNGSGSPTDNAVATTSVTNTGLTGVTINPANTPYDVSNQLTDQRKFTVTGSGGSSGGTVYFDVVLSGLSWMSNISNVSLDPSVAWSGTAAQLGAAASGTSVGYLSGASGTYSVSYVGSITTSGKGNNQTTTVLPNAVSTTITPAGLSLKVQNFNNYDNLGTATVTCTAVSGGSPATVTVTSATRCYNYQVNATGIQIDGTTVVGATASLLGGTTDGGMSEGALITLPSTPGISSTTNTTAGANTVTVPFTLQGTTTLSGTCTCSSKNNCATRYSYTAGVCSN